MIFLKKIIKKKLLYLFSYFIRIERNGYENEYRRENEKDIKKMKEKEWKRIDTIKEEKKKIMNKKKKRERVERKKEKKKEKEKKMKINTKK